MQSKGESKERGGDGLRISWINALNRFGGIPDRYLKKDVYALNCDEVTIIWVIK